MKIPLDEIIKYITSEINNILFISSAGLTAELYKHFPKELVPVLLDVYDSWWNLGTMGITSGAGMISIMYKKADEKDIANYRLIYYNS